MTADIYVRLSSGSRESGALARQEEECRAFAHAHGFRVRHVYVDTASAYRPSSRRGLQGLLAAASVPISDVVVVWRLDRLTRRGRTEMELILNVLDSAGVRLMSVMDDYDSRRDPRDVALRWADIAEQEARAVSQRVRSAHGRNRLAGVFLTGATPYGMRRTADGRVEPDPADALRVRALVEHVLMGGSLVSAAAFANANAWPAPRGGLWQVTTMSQLLRNPVLAGLGSVAVLSPSGRYSGRTIIARHPATEEPIVIGRGIITMDEHLRLVSSLGSGPRGSRKPRSTGLRGLVWCRSCGSSTHIAAFAYTCSSVANGRPCSQPARAYVPAADRAVARLLTARLNDVDAAQRTSLGLRLARMTNPALAARVLAIDQALLAPSHLPFERRAALSAQRQALVDSVEPCDVAELIQGIASEDGFRRAVLVTIRRIDLDPGGGRGKRFDPRRLSITWHD